MYKLLPLAHYACSLVLYFEHSGMAHMLPEVWDIHSEWLFKFYLHPRYQHCTDEVQKAETVVSVVIFII